MKTAPDPRPRDQRADEEPAADPDACPRHQREQPTVDRTRISRPCPACGRWIDPDTEGGPARATY